MARTPSATPAVNADGTAVNADGTAKAKRVLGPRKLYLILKSGADSAAIRESIAEVTFNGRKLLEALGDGKNSNPFLIFKVEVEPKGGEKVAS